MSKIILLDVDGPCASFDREILDLVHPGITDEQIIANNDWDIFKLLTKEEYKYAEEIMLDAAFWRNLPAKKSAQKAVEDMRRVGDTVIFCTSPWSSCKAWAYARTEWLKEHFGALGRKDVIITAAKQYVYGDVLIDDKLSTILDWNNMWTDRKSVLFETPSNTKCEYYPRIIDYNGNWIYSMKKDDWNAKI